MKTTRRSQILSDFIAEEVSLYDYDLGNASLASHSHNGARSIPISFPEDEYQEISDYCQNAGVKRATLIKKAIKKFLEDYDG